MSSSGARTADGPTEGAPAPRELRASYANGIRRRRELADATLEVFAEQGFQQLSIRQIASAVGTSHTMLLHHFGSKEGLLEAVLARREERDATWREEILEEHGLLDGLPLILERNERLRGVLQLDVMLMAEATGPEHPAHDYVVALIRRFVGSLKEGLEAERDAGRLREGLDLDVTARQIAALVHGLQIQWLQDPGVDMAAVAGACTDLLRA